MKNISISFDIHGFRLSYDDFLIGKLQNIKLFLDREAAQVAKANRSALLIAVTRSEADKKIPKLEFAKEDIAEVDKLLSANAPECQFNIECLINPPYVDLKRKIYDLLSKRLPGEEALLYYSGHGIKLGGAAYLCAYDTNLAEIDLSGLRVDDIGRFAGNSDASQVLALLDCCYSGAGADNLFGEELLGDATRDTSIHLLTSTTASRVAKESKNKKMSIFSYYFAEGVRTGQATNSAGEITASSIHSYIAKRIGEAEKNVEPPRYNVKNRKTEFYIRTNAKSQRQIFDEIRSFILQLNTQKEEFRRYRKLAAKKKLSTPMKVLIAAIIFIFLIIVLSSK